MESDRGEQDTLGTHLKKSEGDLLMIWIDHRENRSVVPSQLNKMGVPTEFRNLEVGDYIIENLCIERKEIGDYVSSLVSGRLNNELYQMSFNFPISLIVVEGHIGEVLLYRKIKRQAYLSSLASAVIKRSPDGVGGVINLVMVDTPYDTALFLKYLHDRVTEEGGAVRLPEMIRTKISDEERLIHIVASLPNVGKLRAEALLREFGSVRNLVNASEEELRNVKGIGDKLAKSIHEILGKKFL